MGHGNRGESLSDWKAQTVAEVIYDPGVCFGTRSDFVTYHANLRTEEFYYVYGAGGAGEAHRVLIRKLESEDIESIRRNLDGDNMGERLEELRAFEEKAEGGYLLCCDYRPEELHLTSVDGDKFAVEIDQCYERLPQHLEPVVNPFCSLPTEFFPDKHEMYPDKNW